MLISDRRCGGGRNHFVLVLLVPMNATMFHPFQPAIQVGAVGEGPSSRLRPFPWQPFP